MLRISSNAPNQSVLASYGLLLTSDWPAKPPFSSTEDSHILCASDTPHSNHQLTLGTPGSVLCHSADPSREKLPLEADDPNIVANMSTPSVHSMPEHWTELNISRIQKKSCAEQVEAVKESCKKTCGKDNVAGCPECYGRLLEKLRARYAESDEREWFAQRKAFLHELDGLFQDAKDRKRSIKSIEARIESEKEAWYRWVLRRYPEFIASSDGVINKDELRGMLDDPDRSRDEMVQTMLEGIGQPADWPSSVEAFAEKAAATKSNAAELKKLYVSEFFMNKTTGKVLENAQKYLDEYQNSETLSLEDVIDKIVQDCRQSRISMPQRDNHRKRLDELRRAKTAFEQNKMQAKGLRGAQAGSAGEELYSLPPCSVCQKTVNPQDVLSCSVCQAVAQLGGDSKLTLYCSEACYTKGHVSSFAFSISLAPTHH